MFKSHLRRSISMILFFTATIFIVACGPGMGGDATVTESSLAPEALSSYNNIHLAWLDLGEDKWKELEYENKEQWLDYMNRVNAEVLIPAVQKYTSKKNISRDESKSKHSTPSTGVLVKVKVLEFSAGSSAGSYFAGVNTGGLKLNVKFYDIKSKNLLHEMDVEPGTTGGTGMEGRIDNMVANSYFAIGERFQPRIKP